MNSYTIRLRTTTGQWSNNAAEPGVQMALGLYATAIVFFSKPGASMQREGQKRWRISAPLIGISYAHQSFPKSHC